MPGQLPSLFIGSYPVFTKCPESRMPEFAFIGRSNVGKSSLINNLTGYKQLAKTSSTPGKTQLINLFEVSKSWILADLPGYGFAKVSKTSREKWDKMTKDYLLNRPNLAMVMLLVDARIPPQKSDIEFINWLGQNGLSFSLAFTKADKQSKNATEKLLAEYWKVLKESWEVFPSHIITSSVSGMGRDELIELIEIACSNYMEQQ
ncbi:MAG: yihA [Chitinophagaceae bacterium]|nr:yihA [Chitinophagaceae bacterium]